MNPSRERPGHSPIRLPPPAGPPVSAVPDRPGSSPGRPLLRDPGRRRLTQVAATTRALRSFALQMLDEHMRTCLRAAVAEGGEDGHMKLKEASAAIARLVRP
ncbi:metal-sensing transcriptional repressor [Streptomyces sp. NPDC086122]|uniref:metal-sensitive transcriptional regulator n=1 Tax=Streptomyces sp. NPDC086122 TaxID=3155294 RepID=UPI00341D076E